MGGDAGQVITWGSGALVLVGVLFALVRTLVGHLVGQAKEASALVQKQNDEANRRMEEQLKQYMATVEKQFDRFLTRFEEMTKEMRALTHSSIEQTAWRSITDASINSIRADLVDLNADVKALHQRVTNLINERIAEVTRAKVATES